MTPMPMSSCLQGGTPPVSAPVLEEAHNCRSSQMQELLHGTTTTATTTAPPTATVSNCLQGGNGEQQGCGQQEEWQWGRTNDREGDGRDNDNGRWMAEKTTTGRGTTTRRGTTVMTMMGDEVEEEDKDGMRTGQYQAPPLPTMDDPAPVPVAVRNCLQGAPQVLQMTLAATTPLTHF